MLRTIFMGSSEASAITLRALLRTAQVEVVGVVTQPDRPSGRNQRFTPCACKAFALEHTQAPILTPENINTPDAIAALEALRPDVIVVVAFGQFLGRKVLKLPPLGCLNGHFSLLPKYRGAAPIQFSIAAGDDVTGVTIMQMAPGMDDGDMLMKSIEPIYSDDTAVTLMERLSILGAYIMIKTLRGLIERTIVAVPQEHDQATYAPKLKKVDGMIDWQLPARLIERSTRAFEPWPGAFTFLCKPDGTHERVKVIKAEVLPSDQTPPGDLPAGTICQLSNEGPVVTTGQGLLALTMVQPDGSRRMDGKSYLNGRQIAIGQHFAGEPQLT